MGFGLENVVPREHCSMNAVQYTDAVTSSRHDRASIVDAALRILDEHGLPDLTMRRLATTLDVQASALYWHVENKQTLLAAVADRILSRARPVAADLDWRAATRAEAIAVRDALLAYRDGAEVVLSTRALGLGADEAHARFSAALRRGHEPEHADLAATALLHLVLGDASLTQQRLQADSLGVVSSGQGFDTARTPPSEATFLAGVDLLLAGLDSGLLGFPALRSRAEQSAP